MTQIFILAGVIVILILMLIVLMSNAMEDSYSSSGGYYSSGTSAPPPVSVTVSYGDSVEDDEEDEDPSDAGIQRHPKQKPMRRVLAAKSNMPAAVKCPNCGATADTRTGICPTCHSAVFTVDQVLSLK